MITVGSPRASVPLASQRLCCFIPQALAYFPQLGADYLFVSFEASTEEGEEERGGRRERAE